MDFFGGNMERIEKLRKRALEFDYCKDEFYYLFYREYAKNADANEHQRYSEALYAALSELTPYIGEEELIVGEYHCALSESEKEEYQKRENEQLRLLKEMSFKNPVSYLKCEYNPKEYYKEIKGLEHEKD